VKKLSSLCIKDCFSTKTLYFSSRGPETCNDKGSLPIMLYPCQHASHISNEFLDICRIQSTHKETVFFL
jgi:hypothetical protein